MNVLKFHLFRADQKLRKIWLGFDWNAVSFRINREQESRPVFSLQKIVKPYRWSRVVECQLSFKFFFPLAGCWNCMWTSTSCFTTSKRGKTKEMITQLPKVWRQFKVIHKAPKACLINVKLFFLFYVWFSWQSWCVILPKFCTHAYMICGMNRFKYYFRHVKKIVEDTIYIYSENVFIVWTLFLVLAAAEQPKNAVNECLFALQHEQWQVCYLFISNLLIFKFTNLQ